MRHDPLATAVAVFVVAVFAAYVVADLLGNTKIPKELGPALALALGYLLYGVRKNGR